MSKAVAWLVALLRREPAIIVTTTAAAIGLAASFGFNLNADQTKAIYTFLGVLAGWVIRPAVTPVVTMQAHTDRVEGQLSDLAAAKENLEADMYEVQAALAELQQLTGRPVTIVPGTGARIVGPDAPAETSPSLTHPAGST